MSWFESEDFKRFRKEFSENFMKKWREEQQKIDEKRRRRARRIENIASAIIIVVGLFIIHFVGQSLKH